MNDLYAAARDAFVNGEIDWTDDDVRAVLVDSHHYAVSIAGHEFLSSIPAAARVAGGALTGRSTSGGVADADDLTLDAVTGPQAEAVVIYQDNGSESASRLVLYLGDATGLPVLPNGGAITITWDDGPSRIFGI